MSSTLDHYNLWDKNSTMNWKGLKSSKFAPTKQLFTSRDTISPGLNFPSPYIHSGRRHYVEQLSPQKQFRPIIKPMGPRQHWHLRQSKKKIINSSFTPMPSRKQKLHINYMQPSSQAHNAGIRTFYNRKIKANNIQEYFVEDRMQRKVRINQSELKKQFLMHKHSMSLNDRKH